MYSLGFRLCPITDTIIIRESMNIEETSDKVTESMSLEGSVDDKIIESVKEESGI
jgi:hypothetical protein